MVVQKKVKILANQRIKDNYFKLVLADRSVAKAALPGQFIHARITADFEPLLRRPFSIHRAGKGNLEILYEVVGNGTSILSQKKTGDYLDIMGPLGNGFKIPTPYLPCRPAGTLNATRCILVAGGMGVAPLIFLAEKLVKSKILVLIGAKTKLQILCENEFKKLGCEVKIATDDGSSGFKGYVSDLLKHFLSTVDRRPSTIYACGPKPMLKEIKKVCATRNIFCQASFEENIACGLGACLGCAVKTRNGFKRVCVDGPVFDIKEVVL